MSDVPVQPQPCAKERLAYSVEEVLSLLPFGRNTFYEEAKAGRLKVRKLGRKTIVLAEDLHAYLRALPLFGADAA
jgi:excisionase family DNA binding protein